MNFSKGDRLVDAHGNKATVVGALTYLSVQWDNMPGITGLWPAGDFKLEQAARPFKPGDYVRVNANSVDSFVGCVGMVYEDDGAPLNQDPFWVAVFDDAETDAPFSASELQIWTPYVGDRVLERGEDEEPGTVIGLGPMVGQARVLWDDYKQAQTFAVADLEPYDESDDEDPEPIAPSLQPEMFNEGERVEYHNPFFAEPLVAKVARVGDGVTFLKFAEAGMPDGYYDNEFIQKAA